MSKQVAVFEIFRSLLSLFKIDGPINKMLFRPKLLFLRGISKAICGLVLYTFLEGTNCSFIYNGEVPFLLSSHFLSLNSLVPVLCLELSFKQKTDIFILSNMYFLYFLANYKGYQETHAMCG